MADKPEQIQVPVTSETKKDPRRVEAGKRLAAITYKTHQRETRKPELEYIPKTVEVTKKADESNKMSKESKMTREVYDAVLLTAGAVGISMASKKMLKEPLGTPENVKGMAKLAISVSLSSLLVSYLKEKKYLPDDPFKT
ncbi:Hypothetical predicted protein [Paramuricea clavata]|uniref:Uncharacterized protein n=1 Tax=Paramuricea clavata TaxID=317549 RepID=A0A7D9F0A4_PARCT|nr:Hypothetical predicted protein [Paramuricea clavata]